MRKYITKASERIGVESTSRDGKRAQVVSYSTCENFIIRFCDGKEMKLKNWRYFIEGNFNYEKHFKAPRNREERIGEKKVMNNGLTAEVIEYRGSHDMDILFEDGGKRTGVSWRDFCIGSIAHPTIHGGNVSQNELVLRFYLESLGFVRIPQRSKRSDRVGLEGKELDLYNDKLKIAIEYDGEYSHTKNKDDEGKNKIVEKLGIKLYRFREPGCSGVSGRNYILEDSRFMSASLECCLKSFVRDVLKKDDKFINFEKDKRTIKEYVSNNKRATIHLYEKKKMNNGMVAEIIKMSSCRNITVQFEDGEIVYHKCYQSFVKGNISHPKDTSLAKKNQRLNLRKQMKNGMMAACVAAAEIVGIDEDTAVDALSRFECGFGRAEQFELGKSKARMMLVKNPAGYNQVINQISNDEEECKIAFLLNDRYADGTDISWIWDVDFEALARQSARFTRILVSGVRADDMALRLKYAGFDTGRIEVIRDYENLLEAIGADETPTFIMPTYTAMFDLRGEISKHTDIKAFYE